MAEPKAIFTLASGVHYFAVWFVEFPAAAKRDMMGMIWREQDGTVKARYRHRYYHSPDPWDLEDRKNVYELTLNSEKVEEGIAAIKSGIMVASIVAGAVVDWTDVNGDVEAVMALLKTKSWANLTVLQ